MNGYVSTFSQSPWEITRRLFASVKRDIPGVGLESLRITSFPLSCLEEVLPTMFLLQNLEHLQLIGCIGADDFNHMLSQLGVSLTTYVIMDCYGNLTGIRGPIEELLSLMTAPRRLIMSSSLGDMLCGWSVLTARAAKLTCLKIDDDYIENEDPVVHRGMKGFLAFCEAASSLEQLAITCPAVEKEL
jgi:hypothetical protein